MILGGASAGFGRQEKEREKEVSGQVAFVENPESEEKIIFEPHCTANTELSKLIGQTGISVNDTELADEGTYQPVEKISFEKGSEYSTLEGVISFRGNNFREDPTYGTAEMSKNVLLLSGLQRQVLCLMKGHTGAAAGGRDSFCL